MSKRPTALGTDNNLTYDWKGAGGMALSLYRAQPLSMFVRSSGTPQHVFFLEFGMPEPDGSVIKTLEATVDGPDARAKRWERTWLYAQGYQHHRSWWPRCCGAGPREPLYNPGPGSACHGIKGQSVWYRFTTSGPRTISLTGISGGDVDLYIYQGDPYVSMNLVNRSRNGGRQNESVYVTRAGTYYARAFTYLLEQNNGSCATYNINW